MRGRKAMMTFDSHSCSFGLFPLPPLPPLSVCSSALFDNAYMSATPFRGMKDKNFQPYQHARNLSITLRDEMTSPALVAVVKKSLDQVRPTKRVKRYICALLEEPSEDETMDQQREEGEREIDDYAREIGAVDSLEV